MNYILHIDGDGFFVSCELTRRPDLRGKPVVTGAERGIATALSYEAKALGLKRGDPVFKIRREFPQVVVLPSDFELYGMMAQRMYSIVRRFSPIVEEYSIDECFAEVILPYIGEGEGGVLVIPPPSLPLSKEEGNDDRLEILARCVRDTLEVELGVSFSVGIAPTKTLAKIASNWAKPHGATVIVPIDREQFLAKTPIGKVWGVGLAGKRKLESTGVLTALDFARKDEVWIKQHFHKPQLQTWRELNGVSVLSVSTAARVPQSIQRTRTFTPPSSKKEFLWTQLSKHTEEACMSARLHGLFASRALFFLKTQDFRYMTAQVEFNSTNSPQEILTRITGTFAGLFDSKKVYRATGVTLFYFQERAPEDLFGTNQQHERLENVYKSIDKLDSRFGKHTVFLASSLQHGDARPRLAVGRTSGVVPRRHLLLPQLGNVF